MTHFDVAKLREDLIEYQEDIDVYKRQGVRAYRRMRAGVRKSEKWRFDLQRALREIGRAHV